MKRNFAEWLLTFTDSIANYKYYIDFETVYENAKTYKVQLNMLNSIIGSQDIETEFRKLATTYPEVLKCIPTLLAVRQNELIVLDDNQNRFVYNFNKPNYDLSEYVIFMRETGLFDLLQNHIINNLYDYVLGVETGLNSNARKNRGGHLMEDVVEKYLINAGFVKNETYFKEMYIEQVEAKWGVDLSSMSNQQKATKRFDYVVKTDKCVYGIEANFYASSGTKLNETAKSYKLLAIEAKEIKGFKFVWCTDGVGWMGAKNNLRETFDSLDDIYNINDMKNGTFKNALK